MIVLPSYIQITDSEYICPTFLTTQTTHVFNDCQPVAVLMHLGHAHMLESCCVCLRPDNTASARAAVHEVLCLRSDPRTFSHGRS